jgi:hypothetical protein
MRSPFITLIMVASMLAPCVAFAADPAPAADKSPKVDGASATDASSDDNQIVCRREKLTGTLLPGPRVCKPYKLWRQQQQDSQDLLNNQTMGNLHTNPKGG